MNWPVLFNSQSKDLLPQPRPHPWLLSLNHASSLVRPLPRARQLDVFDACTAHCGILECKRWWGLGDGLVGKSACCKSPGTRVRLPIIHKGKTGMVHVPRAPVLGRWRKEAGELGAWQPKSPGSLRNPVWRKQSRELQSRRHNIFFWPLLGHRCGHLHTRAHLTHQQPGSEHMATKAG